jgi:glycosyltransferase involved in cell wall biosynthesis
MGHWKKPWDRWLLRIYQRLIIDATVTNCEACRQSVINQQGAHPESVVVIENGIDADRFLECDSGATQNTAGGRPSPRVGIVAGLRPVKNVDLFLRAAKLVASDIPGARFDIAGDGPLRRELQSLATELGLRGQVTFHGNVVQVPEFLSTLDVAVLCSSAEGQANSLLEYMAAGRPIVATRVGGNVELIQDERTGLLTEPHDAPALARAIVRLLKDGGLARRLGTAAQCRARQQNSHQVKASRYQQFYRDLLQGRNNGDARPVRRRDVATYCPS